MLHILMLILKLIGIILAAILGILVLLICIVLFVPVRYEAALKCDGTLESLKAKVTVTWLLKLIRADIIYKNSHIRKRIRIAWKSITDGPKDTENKKKTSAEKGAKKNEEKSNKTVSEALEEQKKIPEETEKNETVQTVEKACETQKSENSEKTVESCIKESSKDVEEEQTNSDSEKQTTGKTSQGTGHESTEKSESLSEKIKKKIEAIKTSLKNICDKLKELVEKKDKVMALIQDDVHIDAFQRVKKEVFFLLKKWKPRKATVHVRYGFEDPCTTGQVLAGLSMIYPFLGDDLVIEPDFEHQIFKGYLYLKGKIRISHLVGAAIRLLLSKNVRTTYAHIKEFQL